nr:MAG TPA: hypothetical protein [Caudoviricetes sp.]
MIKDISTVRCTGIKALKSVIPNESSLVYRCEFIGGKIGRDEQGSLSARISKVEI